MCGHNIQNKWLGGKCNHKISDLTSIFSRWMNWSKEGFKSLSYKIFQTLSGLFSTMNFSTPDFSTMNFWTMGLKSPDLKCHLSIKDISTPDFSTMNFSTPWFKKLWLKSPGLKINFLTMGLKSAEFWKVHGW